LTPTVQTSSERSIVLKKQKRIASNNPLGGAHALDLKVLFDTYFKKPVTKRDDSLTPRIETGPVPYAGGSDELRSRYLLDVFDQVNRIVRKKEKRKRRLMREAKLLQKEA